MAGRLQGKLLAVGVAVAMLLGSACSRPENSTSSNQEPVKVRVEEQGGGQSQLSLGFTHTQFSADRSNDPQAVARSREVFANRGFYQNQHIMGWGAQNPEPSPGSYNWDSLDSRIELIRQTDGIPVLTLCCAPDWMKGETPGQTDWDLLDEAPRPEHFEDFASLAGEVARRYPDVTHYQVWSGLRGFYDYDRQRWDYRAFTELYNLVYRELKAVDPDIKVGGPYVTIDSWSKPPRDRFASQLRGNWGAVDKRSLDAFEYWWEHKEGAEFIAVDLSTANRDDPQDPFRAMEKLSMVTEWIDDFADLPIWVSKWDPFADAAPSEPAQREALMTGTLARMVQAGVDVVLLWHPQGEGDSCLGCLWTDTRVAGGGQPGTALEPVNLIAEHFSPGTPLLSTEVSSQIITAIASPEITVLVNHQSEAVSVEVNGTTRRLAPHAVEVLSEESG